MLTVVVNAHAAGERLLFDNPDYDVLVSQDYYCNEPVRLTVLSTNPEIFEADSPELQRIADSAQAVLAFECPAVPGIELEGRLTGLDEPVYFGIAEAGSGWELATRQSIQSKDYEAYQPPADDGEYDFPGVGNGEFMVANLVAGMSVDEARTAVADTFGIEPEYDVGEGVLTMRTGGCPEGYDWAALSPKPEPGWKCLQAWFTDQRLARLYLLDLVQVIERDDPETIEQHLIDRFGEPTYRDSRGQDRGWWRKDRKVYRMTWGRVVQSAEAAGDGQTQDIYNLQAKVLPVGDVTIVTVTLYEPELQPQWSSEPDQDIPDLTL